MDVPAREDADGHVQRLDTLAHWLDSRFRIPGTSIRFGLDSLLGLVPGLGDAATLVPAAYLVMEAHRLGVPRRILALMLVNLGVDATLGAVPVLGDLFDLGFKSNRRNIELIKKHVGRDHDRRG